VHRAPVAAALVLIGACAQAETGPCKPDQFNGLTCSEGPGAARVIAGTISPSKQIAFAWREPGKAPTEEPDIYQVESVLLWLRDGTALAILPGGYWDTGTARANRYDFHAIWSPNSHLVIELLDFRWSTEALRLYSLGEHGRPVLSLDLKPIMELAVRKQLRKKRSLLCFRNPGGQFWRASATDDRQQRPDQSADRNAGAEGRRSGNLRRCRLPGPRTRRRPRGEPAVNSQIKQEELSCGKDLSSLF